VYLSSLLNFLCVHDRFSLDYIVIRNKREAHLMDTERTISLVTLTPEADRGLALAIIQVLSLKGIPEETRLQNRYTETGDGKLRIRTLTEDGTVLCEALLDKPEWSEEKMQ